MRFTSALRQTQRFETKYFASLVPPVKGAGLTPEGLFRVMKRRPLPSAEYLNECLDYNPISGNQRACESVGGDFSRTQNDGCGSEWQQRRENHEAGGCGEDRHGGARMVTWQMLGKIHSAKVTLKGGRGKRQL